MEEVTLGLWHESHTRARRGGWDSKKNSKNNEQRSPEDQGISGQAEGSTLSPFHVCELARLRPVGDCYKEGAVCKVKT